MVGGGSVVNKWNEMCRETAKRKTGADFEVLSASAGGERQNVGSRIVVEQGWIGKMIRLRKYLEDRELLRESLRAKSPKVPFFLNSGALYISLQNNSYKKHVVNRYNGEIYQLHMVLWWKWSITYGFNVLPNKCLGYWWIRIVIK